MTIKRITILLVLLVLSTSVQAQRFNQNSISEGLRDGKFEVGLLLQYQNGSDIDAEGGSALDIDSSTGWGFGFGWNWTEKWNISYRFTLNKPDYAATIVPEDPMEPAQTINYELDKSSHMFNVTYNFLKGPLTPYVQAGLGWTKLDSNILSRPPTTGCWWDPWWGWICATDWETFETTEFGYNVGLGLRWDINQMVYMRGSWNREFIKVDSGNLDFDTLTLEAGFMW
jgi:opacity protein-like surface antigen